VGEAGVRKKSVEEGGSGAPEGHTLERKGGWTVPRDPLKSRSEDVSWVASAGLLKIESTLEEERAKN